MKTNKKGGATDLFVFIIMAFIIAVICGVMFYIGATAKTKLLENADTIQKAMGDGANATDVINATYGKVPTAYESLKWITAMLMIGMVISILISSFMIRTEPAFFIAYLFLWIVAIIVSVPISNTYETIYQNPVLASSFTGFYGQTWIMLNLPTWIIVVGAISGILMAINLIKTRDQYYG